MKLILEEITDIQCLAEGVGSDKSYKIKGVFLQSELKNKNGRIYPRHILEREAQRYDREYIKENRALGELGHPQGPGLNLDRVSHVITELRQDGNNFYGTAKIMDTPFGKIAKNFIDEGIKFGVSSRGVGTLKPVNGYQCVQDDYRLCVGADLVADPSAPDAWVQGIMENKEWVYENGMWKESALAEAKEEIDNASRIDREGVILKLFETFMLGKSS